MSIQEIHLRKRIWNLKSTFWKDKTSSKLSFLGSMFVFGPVVGGIHGYSYRPGGFHKTYKSQWKPHHGPLSWIQVRCLSIFFVKETSAKTSGKLAPFLSFFFGIQWADTPILGLNRFFFCRGVRWVCMNQITLPSSNFHVHLHSVRQDRLRHQLTIQGVAPVSRITSCLEAEVTVRRGLMRMKTKWWHWIRATSYNFKIQFWHAKSALFSWLFFVAVVRYTAHEHVECQICPTAAGSCWRSSLDCEALLKHMVAPAMVAYHGAKMYIASWLRFLSANWAFLEPPPSPPSSEGSWPSKVRSWSALPWRPCSSCRTCIMGMSKPYCRIYNSWPAGPRLASI